MPKVAMNLKVSAICQEDLTSFLRLCTLIQECGRQGTCGTFKVVVDGDGSGRYSFFHEGEGGEMEQFPFMDKDAYNSDKEIKIWLGE